MKICNKCIIGLILFFILLLFNQSKIFASYITNDELIVKKVNNEKRFISGFQINTKVSDVLSNCFSSEYTIKVFDNKNNDISEQSDKTIGTGYIIKLYNNDILKKEYVVVLYGDTNGDASIGAVDALAIVKNKVGTSLFLDTVYEEAGRIQSSTREEEKVPASGDALYLIKYKLNPEEYPINQKMIVDEDEKENIIDLTTPVGMHGELNVSGTNIIDKNGDIFQLKGVSTHGIAWFSQYVNQDAFKYMRNEWGINAVRIAMYSNPNDGYTRDLWNTVQDGVDYATNAGLYVIIDWHILNDNNPNTYKTEAIEFFKSMATKYKDNPNIIYEICNEPNGDINWEKDIKPYAEEVISEIRKIDNNAIIICGTPNWSQDVDVVSKNPITTYKNIMYALHFYAATHKEDLRNKLDIALNNGLPIFVSEFGICDASGNGTVDEKEAYTWIDTLNENNVSWMCWNLSNKNESSSLLAATTSKTTDWTENELSQSGKWLLNALVRKSGEEKIIDGNNIEGTTNGTINGKKYAYNNPVIPVGFKIVETEKASWLSSNGKIVDGWNNGLVIEDKNQNQFVWVPVDKTNVNYEKWCTTNYSYASPNLTDDILPNGINDEFEQIEKFGGFYVARYEAGIPTNISTTNKSARNNVGIPVSKKNQIPWNWINYVNAKQSSEIMYNNNFVQSGLVTGTQWDTIMKWLQNSGVNVQNDSSTWGNYINSVVTEVTEYSAEYGTVFKKVNLSSKPYNTRWILKTGNTEYTNKNNIYDLAGNLIEWSNEIANEYRIKRGGYCNSNSNQSAAYRGDISSINSRTYYTGFRCVLYIK